MKNGAKIFIGLLVALVAIGGVTVLALRYMDILIKPINAAQDILKDRLRFVHLGEDGCDCGCEDCDDDIERVV
ncbi:hypothetical protein FACS1894202_12530 [Clostridia bacterium]|nr:hypothetical protein FACS1894202_12530 [Clostridia bacterium]